jgi:hypothetical protein
VLQAQARRGRLGRRGAERGRVGEQEVLRRVREHHPLPEPIAGDAGADRVDGADEDGPVRHREREIAAQRAGRERGAGDFLQSAPDEEASEPGVDGGELAAHAGLAVAGLAQRIASQGEGQRAFEPEGTRGGHAASLTRGAALRPPDAPCARRGVTSAWSLARVRVRVD